MKKISMRLFAQKGIGHSTHFKVGNFYKNFLTFIENMDPLKSLDQNIHGFGSTHSPRFYFLKENYLFSLLQNYNFIIRLKNQNPSYGARVADPSGRLSVTWLTLI
jgi:hypothetical protein